MAPQRVVASPYGQEAGNQPAEQTMEQKYKNIQVLKGLPASQMRPMMNYISASLGCARSATSRRATSGFDKDDNNHKKIARRMIQMTMDINKNSFQGRTQVSCYTCHRGDEHAVGVPPLPRVAGRDAALERPRPTPQQILAKYAEAIRQRGDRENKDARHQRRQRRGQRPELPARILFASPDKYSLSVSLPQGATTQS